MLPNFPAGHDKHEVLPFSLENWPCKHASQTSNPWLDAALPFGHSSHEVLLNELVALPAKQKLQICEPVSSENEPGSQTSHLLDPEEA